MNAPIIYADFNNADRQGRLRLSVRGSQEDIQRLGLKLCDGMKLIVQDDGLSANAVVRLSEEEHIWVAEIDWSQIKRYPSGLHT